MIQLKEALIGKKNAKDAEIINFAMYGKYLVLPSGDFYTQCKKIRRPTFTIADGEIDFWVMSYEDVDTVFIVHAPTQRDITQKNWTMWSMDKLPDEKRLPEHMERQWGEDDTIGDIKPLTYTEIKSIWDL